MKSLLNSRYFTWMLLSLPFLALLYAWWSGALFYGELIHVSGELSGRLLILTMAITPFRLMFPGTRWPNWLLHRRRYLGVATFFYALLHTVVYLDRKRSFSLIVEEGADFAMWTGWVAFLIFVVLAITSNDVSARLLRRAWKKIHRWVYVAALLLFAHWIFVAFDFMPGLVHFVTLLALEIYRLWKSGRLGHHAKR